MHGKVGRLCHGYKSSKSVAQITKVGGKVGDCHRLCHRFRRKVGKMECGLHEIVSPHMPMDQPGPASINSTSPIRHKVLTKCYNSHINDSKVVDNIS